MKALVFAAGLGTRLRPITDSIPKALVKVGGRPMLEKVIDKLENAGIEGIVVNACHFADQIVRFAESRPGIDISLEKDGPYETGGGILYARNFLEGGRFLVHNVDILSDVDLSWFMARDCEESLATLLLRDAPSDRYLLFDDSMRLVGWTNVLTSQVKSPYPDLDPSKCRRYAFCGIHILSDEVFPLMEPMGVKFSIIDFYLSIAAERPIYGVIAPKDMKLIDIGTPENLAAAQISGL